MMASFCLICASKYSRLLITGEKSAEGDEQRDEGNEIVEDNEGDGGNDISISANTIRGVSQVWRRRTRQEGSSN